MKKLLILLSLIHVLFGQTVLNTNVEVKGSFVDTLSYAQLDTLEVRTITIGGVELDLSSYISIVTASALIGDSLAVVRPWITSNIGDSTTVLRAWITEEINDSTTVLRSWITEEVGDTSAVLRTLIGLYALKSDTTTTWFQTKYENDALYDNFNWDYDYTDLINKPTNFDDDDLSNNASTELTDTGNIVYNDDSTGTVLQTKYENDALYIALTDEPNYVVWTDTTAEIATDYEINQSLLGYTEDTDSTSWLATKTDLIGFGTGDVLVSGTPALYDMAVWTDATTIRAHPYFTTGTSYRGFAMGEGAESSGDYAVAIGENVKARGNHSFATGEGFAPDSLSAIGRASTALGYGTKARGIVSFAWGHDTEANGDYSLAFGYDNINDANLSYIFGSSNNITSGDDYSFAFGLRDTITQQVSYAFGMDLTVGGTRSFAFGQDLTTSANYTMLFGLDATGHTLAQANTMAIMGGKVGIGDLAPLADFSLTGDQHITNDLDTLKFDLGVALNAIDLEINDVSMFSVDTTGKGTFAGLVSSVGVTSTDLVTINQSAHSDGLHIGGYDTQSGEYIKAYITAGGLAQILSDGNMEISTNGSGNIDLVANAVNVYSDIVTTNAIGRDVDNELNWNTDNILDIVINGVTHAIASISTGTGDNDKLVTQGYVDDNSGSSAPDDDFITLGQIAEVVNDDSLLIWDTSLNLYKKVDKLSITGAGGGDVTSVGTPVDNQIGIWTGDPTLEGSTEFTFDGLDLTLGNSVDDVRPTFSIVGDADADAGDDVSETIALTLTPHATPTLSVWDFTSTQAGGVGFDIPLYLGSGAVGVDPIIIWARGETNWGSLQYFEDEDVFEFNHILSVGDNATGLGATASKSIAVGEGNTIASGSGWSGAFGGSNAITSPYGMGFAFGNANTVSGDYSMAIGGYNEVTNGGGGYNFAIGEFVDATGGNSTVFGEDMIVSGASSFGIALADMSAINLTQANTMAIMGGKVGIGDLAPDSTLDVTGSGHFSSNLLVDGNYTQIGADESQNRFTMYANGDDQIWYANSFRAFRSRGTFAVPVIVNEDDLVFEFNLGAYDGTQYEDMARMKIEVDGAVGDEKLPARLTFETRDSTEVAPRARMVIDQFGDITFGSGTYNTDRDITLTFDGETNDGTMKYMEDEDRFDFNNDIAIGGDIISTGSVGRDVDNELNWDTDDNLDIVIGGVTHAIASISTGTGDNDKLVTQGYVDDNSGSSAPDDDFITLTEIIAAVVADDSLLIWDSSENTYNKVDINSLPGGSETDPYFLADVRDSVSAIISTEAKLYAFLTDVDEFFESVDTTTVKIQTKAENDALYAPTGAYLTYADSTDNQFLTKYEADGIYLTTIDSTNFAKLNSANVFTQPQTINFGATGPGTLKLYEDSDLGTDWVSVFVPNLTESWSFSLPADGGDTGDFLRNTDGSGTTEWAPPNYFVVGDEADQVWVSDSSDYFMKGMFNDSLAVYDIVYQSDSTNTWFQTKAENDILYEVQLTNEAGLYGILSDVDEFLESIDSTGVLVQTKAENDGLYIGDLADDASPQLGADLDVVNYSILWDSSPSGDHQSSGDVLTFTNGNAGSVNYGDVCYMADDGDMEFGDADTDQTAPAVVMANATITTTSSGEWLVRGTARDDTWNWTSFGAIDGLIYLTVTATTGNTMSQTAPSGSGDQVQILGWAISDDEMYFNPQYPMVEIQ
ncbi:hypothetical protein ACFL4H_00030 [Candidatus Neomarinimicrobiota bacterium]